MTEAVLARKQIKEFSDDNRGGFPASFDTILMRLTEDLFVSDGPCNTSDRQWKYQQPE
jgi:hypothetical protein